MSTTILTDAQIEQGREATFSTDNPFCPCDSKTMRKAARWAEQAVLQSPEVQELYGLLKEARQQLPLAAACWNEDENRDVADSNTKRVLDLIARIDAAMQEQKT